MLTLLLAAVTAGSITLFMSRGSTRKPAKTSGRYSLYAVDRQQSQNPQVALNRQLMVGGGALLVATGGALVGANVGVLVLLMLWRHFWGYVREAYCLLRDEGRVGTALIDLCIIVVFAAMGLWVTLVLAFHLIIVLCGKLIVYAEDHSHRHLSNMFDMGIRTVWIWRDGVELEIAFGELAQGDVVVVRAGEVIPADGVVVFGEGSVDQCLLTGEAQPLERQVGDTVLASSTLLAGSLGFRVEQSGNETTAGRIAQALEQSADYRLELQWRWVERLDNMAPISLAAAVSVAVLQGPREALLTLLAASGLGYGMRVVVPLQLFSYLRLTAQSLMLVKDGRVFEQLQGIDTVVFDKTGTLTQEQPHVAQIHCFAGYAEDTILGLAAAAEQRQSHPIARAILAEVAARGMAVVLPEEGCYTLGMGITVQLPDGRQVGVGSTRYLSSQGIDLNDDQQQREQHSHAQGGNMVWVVCDAELVGGLEIQPTLRPEVSTVLKQLRDMDIQCCVLSGDKKAPTRYLAEHTGMDQWFAEVLPDGKAEVIKALQAQGRRVCYVGDGINDSLALQQADVSVSLAGASSIAVDTAQVVMTDRSLGRLPLLLHSGRRFQQSIQRSYWLTSTPLALALLGVLSGHAGISEVYICYYSGIALGVGDALRKPSRLALPAGKSSC